GIHVCPEGIRVCALPRRDSESAVIFFKILLSYFSGTPNHRFLDKYSENTLRSSRALRCLILDNNNELKRTETNSCGVSSFGSYEFVVNFHARTQRAQSVPVFSVSSVLSVVFSNTYFLIGNDISNFRVHSCS
ncbi:MAG: hypothetical protein WA144_06705, partial [Candidatus Methanoperedens sp.]